MVTVYKAVDDEYKSGYGFAYIPGTKPKCPDWKPEAHCGNGLHFCGTPHHANEYHSAATKFLACQVRIKDAVLIDEGKLKAPEICKPVYEVDHHGKPLATTTETGKSHG